ncbi:LysM peptidoglycan-binding domain-containing protein [Nocardioides dongkuii]|uniref:LysM peptidoglycan-binding domain-containing protein n=1 Tax=Nocardioides dongkuii TaxID=2760089 RepID=UPI0015F7B300|nr:LysM peptidoglycan-binding domain-containing protein [Nocardioides dongkuii]
MSTMTHPMVPTTTLRLTRRGRLAVFVLSMAVLLAVGLFVAAGSVASNESGAAAPTTVVTVGTGETLWDIAADASGDGDTREMVQRIERLNALDSAMLVAGQRLRVPTE